MAVEVARAVPSVAKISSGSRLPSIHEPLVQPHRMIPRGAELAPQASIPGLHRTGVIRFTYNLLSTEGASVFWRGLIPRLARRTLATALAWTTFEELNQRFLQHFSSHSNELVKLDPTSMRRD